MKRRVRKIANFFAFNLLFFALYLNFIHKDKAVVGSAQAIPSTTAAFSGTVLVDNPEQYLQKKNETAAVSVDKEQKNASKSTAENSTALKLSIN
ncbi:MAG: hypothetical protein IPN39_08545 [Chitinophagaceae bacterium]|jgi:hypothetical protein|nr:hypothetical protein [Chitinophagaceae bacterium]MBL0307852.1 hypothetical protein [Chitinophagaceae bacterium]